MSQQQEPPTTAPQIMKKQNEAVAGKLFGLKPVKTQAPWAKKSKKKPLTAEQKAAKREKWEAGAPARKERQEYFKKMAAEQRERVKNYTPEEKKAANEKRTTNIRTKAAKIQAGLVFPVKKVSHKMRKDLGHVKFTEQSAVFMAAILEYMTAELLELAGNVTTDNKKKRIIPRHIMLAIRNDDEIEKFIGRNAGVVLPSSGTNVKIAHALVQKNAHSMPESYWNNTAGKFDDFQPIAAKAQVERTKQEMF